MRRRHHIRINYSCPVFLLIFLCAGLCWGQKSGYLIPPGAEVNSSFFMKQEVWPTVMIATLVRNMEHTLPYFLTALENLDYPRDRIAIWMKSDHNEDNTTQILRVWGEDVQGRGQYHLVSIDITDVPPFRQSDQFSRYDWSLKRYQNIIRLKEEAVRVAKKIWADYVFFLDADAFLVNNQTLKHLVSKKKDVVAPMLVSSSLYSNFWVAMNNYCYKRTEEYKEIVHWKKTGCFQARVVHSAVLMNVRRTELPDFIPVNDTVPENDFIRFATSAEAKGIPMEVCNDLEYGYILSPAEESSTFEEEELSLQNLRVEVASYWDKGLEVNELLTEFVRAKTPSSTIGLFDQVYLINLKRRPDRLKKMDHVLGILGIDYELVEAVDGKKLTQTALDDMKIKQLETYRDPYSKRVMTFGEVGCFLSHYKIWEKMVKYNVNTSLILEDDALFYPFFTNNLEDIFEDSARINLDWDLIYLGRKKLPNTTETWVTGSKFLVHVDYTYWAMGYVLTLQGAKKLLGAKPLEKLIPVDEFLPIMFNRHPNETWKSAFPKRDLKAFSAEPLLLYPTHYTNEPGHISDTERSPVILPSSDLLGSNCTTKKDEL